MNQPVDLILVNGQIRTLTGSLVQAAACAGERIVAVGSPDDVASWRNGRWISGERQSARAAGASPANARHQHVGGRRVGVSGFLIAAIDRDEAPR